MSPETKTKIIGAEIDREVFKYEVWAILDPTPIIREAKEVLAFLSWPPKFSILTKEVCDVVAAVASAVEIVKQRYISLEDPDNTGTVKFDRELAASTAAVILDSLIQFTGIVGRFIEMFDGLFWKIAVSVFVNGKARSNWLADAYACLKKISWS